LQVNYEWLFLLELTFSCANLACMRMADVSLPAEPFEERQEFNLHETHFDIITKPAPGMTVLGWGKNTPVQMCCVGDHFLGARHPAILRVFSGLVCCSFEI
jgi:hypothetical protein